MGAPPPVATPVGPWVVDFDPRHCIASRQFDAGGIPIILGIEAIPTQDAHYIYFQRSGKLRVMALESATVWLGGKRAKSGALIGVPVVQKDNVRYSTSLDVEEYRQFVDGSALSVRSSPIKVALPPMNLKAVDARLRSEEHTS